jgi:membrane-associated phospholipid phosphatase
MDLTYRALASNWYARGARRLMHLWLFKATATAAFMGVFFYSYFAVLHSPVGAVTLMPLTAVDDWIAFWPPAFYLYASLWVYTALVPALQPSLVRLVAYGFGIGSLCLSGLVIFWFFPTAVPYEFSSWFTDPSLSLLRSLDLAGNACPSLHVATAIFTAMAMHQLLRDLAAPQCVQRASWLWCALIVYSTMAIKQHVLWDVLAGLALGVFFGWLYRLLEAWLAKVEAK